MRPAAWPWDLVPFSTTILEDVVGRALKGGTGRGARARHQAAILSRASSYHKVLPSDMLALHDILARRPLSERRERALSRLNGHAVR